MKTVSYYLMSIAISLGILVFLRSAYALIDSFIHFSNPFKADFWDFYLESFSNFGLYFSIIGLMVFFAVIILLNKLRKRSLIL